MPNFVTIRQFEQKNDSKNFAGGGKRKKSRNYKATLKSDFFIAS